MVKKLSFSKVIVLLLSVSSILFSQTETKLIWVDDENPGKVQMCNTLGENHVIIADTLNQPISLDIDTSVVPNMLYIGERGASRISRIDINGNNYQIMVTNAIGIRDLELDLKNRKIYWVRNAYADCAVVRASMDTVDAGIEELYHTTYNYDYMGIAVDTKNEQVFWTRAGGSTSKCKIWRMGFDKTGMTAIFEYPDFYMSKPWDIEVFNDSLYFSDTGLHKDNVYISSLSGSGVDTVLADVSTSYFTIDSIERKIYWNESYRIVRSSLDSTDIEEIVTGLTYSNGDIVVAYNLPVTAIKNATTLPNQFELNSNYPNPFNAQTTISYTIPKQMNVKIDIYNILGQKMFNALDGQQTAGFNKLSLNLMNLPSGIYFYKVSVSDANKVFTKTSKMVLIK